MNQPDQKSLNIKTAYTVAAVLLLFTIAVACNIPDSKPDPAAPNTAQCLLNTYQEFNSTSGSNSMMFATVFCSNSPAVQAELALIPTQPDQIAECQEQHRSHLDHNYPTALRRVYAAMVCIR